MLANEQFPVKYIGYIHPFTHRVIYMLRLIRQVLWKGKGFNEEDADKAILSYYNEQYMPFRFSLLNTCDRYHF